MSIAENTPPGAVWRTSTGLAVTAGLALWLAIAWGLGSSGVLSAPPTETFRPVLLSVVVPVILFLAAYAGSVRFRKFLLSLDIRVLTMLQLWRVVGFCFLPLYAYGVLPGLFAWPAGLGDVAIGLAAPVAVLALVRRPDYAKSGRFMAFNLLGITDFIVAAGTATLASGAFPSVHTGPLTSIAMEIWPLNIFPSLLVPLFLFAHLTVLLQVRALRRRAAG